jgi:transcriptional regulator of acetoin/glycerol metabolism
MAKAKVTALTPRAAKEIQRAWEHFVAGKETPLLEKVRPAIRESWRRSRQAGVSANIHQLPTILTPDQLDRRCQQNARLLDAVDEAITHLSQKLPIGDFIAAIVDKKGIVLRVSPPFQSRDKLMNINFCPGAGIHEHHMGTNAGAIALHLDSPYVMYGDEHYAELVHHWSGGGVPIHSVCREILGVFGICTPQGEISAHTLDIVTSVAKFVEQRMRPFEELAHFEVLKQFNHCLLEFPESPLLALCPHGRILALSQSLAKLIGGPAPERLIGRSLHEVRDLHCEGLFRSPEGDVSEPYESLLRFPHKEKSCASTVIPIWREGQSAGLVIIASGFGQSAAKTATKPVWQTTHTFSDLIGVAPVFRSVMEQARQAAAHDWPVLLVGESGTGKELFAHAIHRASRRTCGPFVALNLSMTPKELVSAELFGYEEGAFSGALRGGKRGKVELAHGGTLFLDELGDLPIEIQAGLLRFLEEGTIVPLGSDRPRRVDVRVMAAMNAEPTQALEHGKLRLDLFHRLNVFPLHLPPLRDRREDISLLAPSLLDKEGFSAIDFAPDVMELFCHYAWPGNIRELRNVLIRAAVRASHGFITRDLLPPELLSSKPPTSPPLASSRRVGREQIAHALQQCNGNLAHAAQLLHIHRATFYRKMHQYGLTREEVTR